MKKEQFNILVYDVNRIDTEQRSIKGYRHVISMPGWSKPVKVMVHRPNHDVKPTREIEWLVSEHTTGLILCLNRRYDRTIKLALANATDRLYEVGETVFFDTIAQRQKLN